MTNRSDIGDEIHILNVTSNFYIFFIVSCTWILFY